MSLRPVERPLGTERRGRGFGGVLVRGADRLQLVVGQSLQGGHVGIGPQPLPPVSRSLPRFLRESCPSSDPPGLAAFGGHVSWRFGSERSYSRTSQAQQSVGIVNGASTIPPPEIGACPPSQIA